MPALSLKAVLRVRGDVRFRRVFDEGIVVHQKSAEALVLNEVAFAVVERSDGLTSLGAIIKVLETQYDIDTATLTDDVLSFARELIDSGILETEESS